MSLPEKILRESQDGCAIADHWFISKIDAYASLAAILKKNPPRIGQEPDFTEHQAALHKLMKPHGHVIQPMNPILKRVMGRGRT
jgi:hypothetical protein